MARQAHAAASSAASAPAASPAPRSVLKAVPPARAADWLSVPERGTLWGLRAVIWTATAFGRAPVRLLVRLIALYYVLFDRKLVEASRGWWMRIHGRSPSWRTVYAHVRRFANVTLDRMFLLRGRTRGLVWTRDGKHHLDRLSEEKKGAILLGAHLGSFEAMRLAGNEERHRINIVGDFSNAKMLNTLLDKLSPDNTARVIHVGPKDVSFVFTIQERIAAGEMVAILGDRVAEHQPSIEVEFFGCPARFPVGPLHLAALLKCPVYLVFGIFREPNYYALSCELFSEQVVLPRGAKRQDALRNYVQRYANRLEEKARGAPDNWFNFYDFWS